MMREVLDGKRREGVTWRRKRKDCSEGDMRISVSVMCLNLRRPGREEKRKAERTRMMEGEVKGQKRLKARAARVGCAPLSLVPEVNLRK